MTHLRLVAAPDVVGWPWHLRFCDRSLGAEHPVGARCRRCGQDIAVPRRADPRGAVCLYCAMDEGIVEAVDVEPWEDAA